MTPKQREAARQARVDRLAAFLSTFDFSVPVPLCDVSIAVDREFGDTPDAALLSALSALGVQRKMVNRTTYLRAAP